MREIKFRAWDKNRNSMAYQEKMRIYDGNEQAWDITVFKSSGTIGTFQSCLDNSKEVVLMQYTGLKDKNGKEIYEGDVVDMWNNGVHSVVEWYQSGYYLITRVKEKVAEYMLHGKSVIVVGNIYENPELMK